jgi:hypothetical protein
MVKCCRNTASLAVLDISLSASDQKSANTQKLQHCSKHIMVPGIHTNSLCVFFQKRVQKGLVSSDPFRWIQAQTFVQKVDCCLWPICRRAVAGQNDTQNQATDCLRKAFFHSPGGGDNGACSNRGMCFSDQIMIWNTSEYAPGRFRAASATSASEKTAINYTHKCCSMSQGNYLNKSSFVIWGNEKRKFSSQNT